MSSRLTLAGLGLGAAAALAILVAIVVLVPEPLSAGSGPSASAPAASPGASAPIGSPTVGSAAPATAGPGGTVDPNAAFHVGQPAPALSLPQLGGGRIELAALRGQPVWLTFMATTCPSCRDEFPLMTGFAARYAQSGLVVIAIDVREDEGLVAAFAQGLNAAIPIGLDADGTAGAAWGAVALPVHFWIDRDGVIRAGALSGIGPDIMATDLQTILPGVTVTP